MKKTKDIIAERDRAIAKDMESFFYDPAGFVYYAYPWEQLGPLKDHPGPDVWQEEVMDYIGGNLKTADTATRVAIASGNGSGKSTLISFLVQWFMSTRTNPQIVVTANTKTQLITKLWRELSIWHRMMINENWFEWQATSFKHKESPSTWAANAIPWSDNNPEAFAGTHARDVMIVFDEASAISDSIWEAIEGALTTPGSLWVCTGNPTRSSGKFFECFNRFKHRWKTWQIDTRTCRMTNKAQIQEWIEDYGEDSDFTRVRVKGEFPRAGSTQLISTELVDRARLNRTAVHMKDSPRIMGVDVARFGDDFSAIAVRDTNILLPVHTYSGLSTMELADEVARKIDLYEPDGTIVDANGLGAGTYDRLVQLHYPVIPVNGAEKPDDDAKYRNTRAELWGRMSDWFRLDVRIPADDEDLRSELIAQEYGFNEKNQIQLVKKEQMKKDGLPSPDRADATSFTFAKTIRKEEAKRRGRRRRSSDWRTA